MHISRCLLVSLRVNVILQEPMTTWRVQKLGTSTESVGFGDPSGVALDQIKGQGREKARLGIP